MKQEKLHFINNIVKQKPAYVEQVLMGSSGSTALLPIDVEI